MSGPSSCLDNRGPSLRGCPGNSSGWLADCLSGAGAADGVGGREDVEGSAFQLRDVDAVPGADAGAEVAELAEVDGLGVEAAGHVVAHLPEPGDEAGGG